MFRVKTVREYYEKGKSISATPHNERIYILTNILVDLKNNPENWYLFVLLFAEVEDGIPDVSKIGFYNIASYPIQFYLSRRYPELAVDFFLAAGRPHGMIKSYIQAGITEFGSDDEQKVLLERGNPFLGLYENPLMLRDMKRGNLIRPNHLKTNFGTEYTVNYGFSRKMTEKALEILEEDIPLWIEKAFLANDGVAAEEFLEKAPPTDQLYNNMIENYHAQWTDLDRTLWMIFNLQYRFMKDLSKKIENVILKKGAEDRFYAYMKRRENVTQKQQNYQQLINPQREGIVRPLRENEAAIRKISPERQTEEIISTLTFEPVTGDYVKCKNPHAHFFEADEFAKYCQVSGTDCLLCPVDRTYPMDPRLFHSENKSLFGTGTRY